jgi:hypothetical protein
MRISAVALALLACSLALPVHAQDDDKIPPAVYPALPARAPAAEGFVPNGWVLESQVAGDLNRDGIPDLALVLHESNPKNILPPEGLGESLDTNPRMLVVAFGTKPGGYTLALENHTLIPRRTVSTLDDPLSETGGVSIERGLLQVKLRFFASAGAWTMSTTSYGFRFQNGAFELVGFDRDETARNSGKTTAVSINYLTGKMSTTSGRIDKEATTVRWKKLPRRPLLAIDRIGDGIEFEPK